MKSNFAKNVIVYFELFVLAIYLNANALQSGNNYGSYNKENNSILEECLVIPHSSFNRSNNQTGDERTPTSSTTELFILSFSESIKDPKYSVMLESAESERPATPEYILSTDEKSPPAVF